jgi:16S rRNA (cytosine1402-N4)-methyltransferase
MISPLSHNPNHHIPVLLTESIEALNIQNNPNGIYIDGTFGRGGHSQEILKKLGPQGKLIAFDKDLAAHKAAIPFLENEIINPDQNNPRFTLKHDSFSNISAQQKADGILLDLGVSSPQIDTPERGFSFKHNGPLDMRMDQSRGETVAELLTHISEEKLSDILFTYGEEKFARKISKAILTQQKIQPITTTKELQKIIAATLPFQEKHKDPATRTFQALRIFINKELEDLEIFLSKIPELLNPGGRIAIITFHSLEDRLVKNAFGQLTREVQPLRGLPIRHTEPNFTLIAQKIRPSEKEETQNVRSRSALLRVIQKN